MFGLWKTKAMSQTAQSRNPNYGQIFYTLLERHNPPTSLSRDTYDSMFVPVVNKKYVEYKEFNTMSFSVELAISNFTTTILETLSKHSAEERNNPQYYYAFGYGDGLVIIGDILFALAPGLSTHGLQEVEKISKSVIFSIMGDIVGGSSGLGPNEFKLRP